MVNLPPLPSDHLLIPCVKQMQARVGKYIQHTFMISTHLTADYHLAYLVCRDPLCSQGEQSPSVRVCFHPRNDHLKAVMCQEYSVL